MNLIGLHKYSKLQKKSSVSCHAVLRQFNKQSLIEMEKFRFILVFVLLLLTVMAKAEGNVSGQVLEQDGVTPIEMALVSFSGISVEGDTLSYQFESDTIGLYEAVIEAGIYQVWASAEGYTTAYLIDSLIVEEEQTITGIDFILYETCNPVDYVSARYFGDDMVRVSWSMRAPLLYEDFETGDFSRFPWDNTVSAFPWVIDTTHAYSGTYCMKSTCEGQEDGLSQIEVVAFVPSDGQMRFFSRISSESLWDIGSFYIDGNLLLECSGDDGWEEHVFPVTQGEHFFRWSYRKDVSSDEADDCFYVDEIQFLVEDTSRMAAPTHERSFQYYDLFRRRFGEEPVLLASHLTDTVFMDMNWGSMDWGKYAWGVSCRYEGNRAASDTVWSVYLDKEMTTAFELDVTTNVGLVPEGATVVLTSESVQGQSYMALLDANGHLLLTDVYRDDYRLSVSLEGYEDFESEELVSIYAPVHLEIELVEKIKVINDLYVSSTGWAMWQLSDSVAGRNLQYYEIQLDSSFVATTTESHFQFDEAALEDGHVYSIKVRPVFLSGCSDWVEYEWIFRPCSDFEGVAEMSWSVQDEAVSLSWNYPENADVVGALLYRDGNLLGLVDGTAYVDAEAELHGTLDYCLKVVYGGPFDGTYYAMSCLDCIQADFPAYCDPPQHLEGENYWNGDADYGALISWGDRPPLIESWLHYDDGTYRKSIGNDEDMILFWSVRFSDEVLADYQGTMLTHVSLFDVGAGVYQLWIYVGGDEAPSTMVRYQNMNLNGSFTWFEQTVEPLEIPANEPIWIVVGQQGLSRPAAACDDMGDPDGRWVSQNGTDWHDMHYYNLFSTWMLRAFVTNQSGKLSALGNDGFILQHYNLFRSYNNSGYQQIASVPFVEGQPFYQYRDVLVGDEHHEFYYRLTAVYLSDEGETCESDFAASLWFPENNYVLVDDHWSTEENVEDAVEVYPNPARDRLVVEVPAMRHLSVFNALGQCVIAEECVTDVARIDLSSCPNGLYLLKVETNDAVLSRCFVVAH